MYCRSKISNSNTLHLLNIPTKFIVKYVMFYKNLKNYSPKYCIIFVISSTYVINIKIDATAHKYTENKILFLDIVTINT